MRSSALALLPCALVLSACTAVTPAFKDIGTRSGPCVSGGPDEVAQQFYDYRIAHKGEGLSSVAALRPYLSDSLFQLLQKSTTSPAAQDAFIRSDIFSSQSEGPDKASVYSASTIPNTDARNIPLRVELTRGSQTWKDEVLMVREGQCWAVDDVRYLGAASHAPTGTLRQAVEGK